MITETSSIKNTASWLTVYREKKLRIEIQYIPGVALNKFQCITGKWNIFAIIRFPTDTWLKFNYHIVISWSTKQSPCSLSLSKMFWHFTNKHLSCDCLDNSFIHLYDLLPLCFGPCPVRTDIECAALPVPRRDWNLPLLSVVSLNVGLSRTWHSNPNIQKQGPAELKLWENIPKKFKISYY